MALNRHDRKAWLETIWLALECYREDCIPGEEYNDDWDELCTAMAWIAEELGVQQEPDEPAGQP